MEDYLRNPFLAAISRPFKSIARNEHDTATAMKDRTALRISAEKDLAQAQRELGQSRREQKALNVRARRIQAGLEAFSAKKLKLVSYGVYSFLCGYHADDQHYRRKLLRQLGSYAASSRA